VLILGETGVGKDVLAKVIHNLSPRRAGPFIKVNCAAIPENMLEAELFGYKKGAFTDAKQDKPGKFQLAQSGTIFLDEISELRYDMQAKLLQALEDKEVFPLGGISIENINARVIAATNRDLNKLIEMNAFRRDLYYRLKLCEFFIPPLRDRLMDIPLLLDHFISEAAVTSNKKIYGISHEAKRLLMEYSYPGNIREMKNIIEYAVLVTQETIEVHDLPSYLLNQGTEPRYYILDSQRPFTLEEGEKATLYKALEANNWHIQHAADNLGINRTTLWRKMKRFNLSRERE
jgi:transcriptional regulator with PAS, ATPase and Fis domain